MWKNSAHVYHVRCIPAKIENKATVVIKKHVMNLYGAADVQLHAFSASAYIKENGLFHLLAALTPVYKLRKNSMSMLL